MKYLKYTSIVLLIAFASGCAIGNKYDYTNASVSLPVTGSIELGLAVVENRTYVTRGNKNPNFVGIQRGGYGNPFNVTTTTGNPLSQDMATSLHRALEQNGFSVITLDIQSPDASAYSAVITQKGLQRNVILRVDEWKTDIMARIRLIYDLQLIVTDETGLTLASNRLQGDEVIGGGGLQGNNSSSAASAFETKVGRLFNTPEIISALN